MGRENVRGKLVFLILFTVEFRCRIRLLLLFLRTSSLVNCLHRSSTVQDFAQALDQTLDL